MTQSIMIRTEQLHRIYHTKGENVHAVNDVSIEIEAGKITGIIGRSGAGKTTLLNVISGLDEASQGKVWLDGQDLFALSDQQRTLLRRDKMGFVFQNFGLLPLLSAYENVSIPLRMRKLEQSQIDQQVNEVLDWVGLQKRANHRPYELSGGEQQRVGLARALVAKPQIIFADEPTGQLDSQTGKQVLMIMRQLVLEQGITMMLITHDPQAMETADTLFELSDGKIVEA